MKKGGIRNGICDCFSICQNGGERPGEYSQNADQRQTSREKIGNQWVLHKDTVFPSDRRVKSGKYRNWRKPSGSHGVDPILFNRLLSLSDAIREVYGNRLAQIVLYGSYARGSQTEESDLDIALFLEGEDDTALYDRTTA